MPEWREGDRLPPHPVLDQAPLWPSGWHGAGRAGEQRQTRAAGIRDQQWRASAPSRRYLVVVSVLWFVVAAIAYYYAAQFTTPPGCGPSLVDCHLAANTTAGPEMWAKAVMASALATVLGVAWLRRAHRAAWALAVAGQLVTLAAIIVPVVLTFPYEIGWSFPAVFPVIGVGLLLGKGLRVAPTAT